MRTPALVCTVCLTIVVVFSGCSGDNPIQTVTDDGGRTLVTSVRLESVSLERFESFGLPVSPLSAVDVFSITYLTVDAVGTPTIASALLAVPTDPIGALAVASYQHGTVVRKGDVASQQGLERAEALVAVTFAATGYLAVMPDYLGLGVSPGLHPFVHAASLATAVADALRAARDFAAANDLMLENDVYLLGYSEGGYATAAAQKFIEQNLSDEFTIGASAPMAAPFDLSGVMVELLASDEPYPAPFFLPYTLLAYNSVYELADSPSQFLVEPFNTTIPPAFDGTKSGGEIDALLPTVPKAILPSSFVSEIQSNESFPWGVRLRENTLLSWTPMSPTRIYHCENDELIPVDNARRAVDAFGGDGASTMVDLVTGDFGKHAECAPVFILLAKFWIDEIRTGRQAKMSAARLRADPGVSAWRPIL